MATVWTSLPAHEEITQITCALGMQATSVALLRLLTNLLARMLEDAAWTSAPVLGRLEQGFVDPSLHLSGEEFYNNQQSKKKLCRCCIEDEFVDDCNEGKDPDEDSGPGPAADATEQNDPSGTG